MVQKALKKNPNKVKRSKGKVATSAVTTRKNAPQKKVLKGARAGTRLSVAQTHKRLQKKAHGRSTQLIEKQLAEAAIKNDGNNPMRLLKVRRLSRQLSG